MTARVRLLIAGLAIAALAGCGNSHSPTSAFTIPSTVPPATAPAPPSTAATTIPTTVPPTTTKPITTTTSTTKPAANETAITITESEDGKTITAARTNLIELTLSDTGLRWSGPDVNPTGILAPDPSPSPPPNGIRAVWTAVAPGTVRITATATPICPAGQACPMYARLWQVTVVVT